jgi:hypothetical protein
MASHAKESRTRLIRLEDLDRRTAAFRQVQTLTTAIQTDVGHETTAAEDELIRNAAIAGAMIESLAAQWLAGQEIEPCSLTALMNVQQRLLSSVGLRRRSKEIGQPSLESYLAASDPTLALQKFWHTIW